MATGEIDRFVDVYVQALRDENAAVFAGAGLSIPAGLVDWAALMADIAADVGLSVDRETDLLSVAQFHVNERGGRHQINQKLINEFAERSELTENHRILASLPIRTYWTTNYDPLLEQALRNARKRVDVKTTEASLATTLPRRDAVVYKMHGDIGSANEAVITRDDYEAYSSTHPLFSTALQGDLVSRTFLFIGFSFNDPNLNYLLSRIRLLLGQNRRDHYCLLRRVQPGDFDSEAEYHYARGRQDLQVRDLRRYGIQGLLLDSYADYTGVLQTIAWRFRRRRVFVSGSAAAYAPWSDEGGQDLLRALGAALIGEGLDVVTGFGLGVGPYLLNGVLEGLEKTGTHSFHDRVTLRPFPQGIADPAARAARWRAYRRAMIQTAGIALFVFGNRRGDGGEVELAAGVREEFELAVEQGLLVVPVGATGYVARELHARVVDQYDTFFPGRPEWRSALASLGDDSDPATLIPRVVSFLSTVVKER
jgi:Sir2- and TIR-associating SLOG family/SIR2-like domain